MNSKEQLLKDLIEYKNYLSAIQNYKEYGNLFGDKQIIDKYEEKIGKGNARVNK